MTGCGFCEYAREVELLDRSRVLVCDGGWDEMVQVCPMDSCEYLDPIVDEGGAEIEGVRAVQRDE